MKLVRTKTDRKIAVAILTEAFYDAENIDWFFKSKTKANVSYFFLILVYDAMAKRGAYLTEDTQGVLLFYRPNDRRINYVNIVRKIYVLLFVTGIPNGLKILKHNHNMNRIRPSDGWLGQLVATTGKSEASAAGFEIKNFMNKVSFETQSPLYVETTVPRVRLLYRAVGYRAYKTIQHPYADLNVWFMKREVDTMK